MRTEMIERDVYTYDELSEAAKEHAREQYNRWGWDDGIMQESMQLIADGILAEVGLREAGNLTYSLYSQGGTPKFETSGAFSHDGESYSIGVTTEHTGGGHYRAVIELYFTDERADDWDAEIPAAARTAAVDFISGLSNKMYMAFVAEDEYQSSDEVVSEVCEANGYEFDEEGNLV